MVIVLAMKTMKKSMKKTMTQMKVINKYKKTEVISFGFFIALITPYPPSISLRYLAPLSIKQSLVSHAQPPNPSTKNTRHSK